MTSASVSTPGSPPARDVLDSRRSAGPDGDKRARWDTRADVGPRTELAAGVVVASGVIITVDTGATVGAGAVVANDVEPGAIVVGIPAKPLVHH